MSESENLVTDDNSSTGSTITKSTRGSKDSEIVLDAKETLFTSKEKLYYKMVDKFFRNTSQTNIKKMINIIEGDYYISLRLLDWFVTRYANKYKITYNLKRDDDRFNVHISYKAQLKSYKKKYFDPFRRRKKFYYSYNRANKSEKMETTIGQLNFFRWAFTYEVLDYVEDNYKTIHNAMVVSNKEDKKRKEQKKTTEHKHRSKDTSDSKSDGKTGSKTGRSDDYVVKKEGIQVKAEKQTFNKECKITLSFD